SCDKGVDLGRLEGDHGCSLDPPPHRGGGGERSEPEGGQSLIRSPRSPSTMLRMVPLHRNSGGGLTYATTLTIRPGTTMTLFGGGLALERAERAAEGVGELVDMRHADVEVQLLDGVRHFGERAVRRLAQGERRLAEFFRPLRRRGLRDFGGVGDQPPEPLREA